jgi:hypothetical protein
VSVLVLVGFGVERPEDLASASRRVSLTAKKSWICYGVHPSLCACTTSRTRIRVLWMQAAPPQTRGSLVMWEKTVLAAVAMSALVLPPPRIPLRLGRTGTHQNAGGLPK